MTRYIRIEEIDGDLVVRVPANVARELGLSAGDATVHRNGNSFVLDPVDERKKAQLERMMRIIEENDAVLAALAK